MSAFGLMPFSSRSLGVAVLLALVAGGTAALAWQVQAWRYERQLAQAAQIQAQTLSQITQAAAIQQKVEQDKRLALEQQLSASEQSHYRALSDAQRDQDRLRDRLTTADVRIDRKSVVEGKSVSVRVDLGGSRCIKKKKK